MMGAMGRMATAMAGAALFAVACNPSRNAFQLGLPGTRIDVSVGRVVPRAGYLDVELHAPGWVLRTFLPADEVCSRVVAGETAQYVSDGAYGAVARGSDLCSAAGLGSLAEWRSSGPRATGAAVIPSAAASYRKVYEDAEVVFLRGNFPLASRLGFHGLGDAIAVVPKTPICQRPLERTSAKLEYFPVGPNVLTLGSEDGRCNIEGLIQPLSEAKESP